MFTGLVESVGKVESIKQAGEGKRVRITGDIFDDAAKGDSINTSGACLTIEKFTDTGIEVFLAEETLDRTWFSQLSEDDCLNLERSLTPQDRMGGHYVQGHVDEVSEITKIKELEEGWNFTFTVPSACEQYIVEKGFVAIEGISLTVTQIQDGTFSVTIIPETWEKTNLSNKSVGQEVNIEVDIMAKYAEKAVKTRTEE